MAETKNTGSPTEEPKGQQSRMAQIISDEIIVGQKAAAKFINVETKTIQRWSKKGLPSGLRDRTKTYRTSDLKLFKDSEGATVNPHKEREQKANAGIKEKKDLLLDFAIKKEQGEFINREEDQRRHIAQITAIRRAHQKFSREIMPSLRPYLRNPDDCPAIKAAMDNKLRQIDELFADGINR
jgi:hypothetical protein